MPEPSSAPRNRPRSVDAAFWLWLIAAVLTAALGLLQLSLPAPAFFRLVGVLWLLVGLAQGFLAGRARRGDARFARAALALALTTVVFDALLLVSFVAGFVIVILLGVAMLLLVAGCVSVRRPAAQAWFADVADG